MAAGLVGYGRDISAQAQSGLASAARMERKRETTEKRLDAAERSEQVSNTAMGAMAGASVGGPVGMAVGAVVGYAATELF